MNAPLQKMIEYYLLPSNFREDVNEKRLTFFETASFTISTMKKLLCFGNYFFYFGYHSLHHSFNACF